MITKKFFGALLLISGSCIGAGMLAFPITMSPLDIKFSILSLTCMWIIMCFTGLLVVEVLLWMPPNTNYISMAKNTLGNKGKIFTWLVYMFLLYSLLAAYTTVGGELITSIESKLLGRGIPYYTSYIIWIFTFAIIIYFGIAVSEIINRILLIGLITSFAALSAIITPHVDINLLFHTGHYRYLLFSLPIVAAAFGYHIIIPSIRDYLSSNSKLITWSIIIGTFIPFCIYSLWVLLIFGIIPTLGEHGLISIIKDKEPVEILMQNITNITKSLWLGFFIRFFVFFAITSSFIAVSIGLFDLLSDGLKIKKNISGKFILTFLTFMPPLLYTLIYPEGFILALGYAGLFVAILHGILPAAMVWAGRYHYWQGKTDYRVWGGKLGLLLIFVFSLLIVFSEIGDNLHWIPLPE